MFDLSHILYLIEISLLYIMIYNIFSLRKLKGIKLGGIFLNTLNVYLIYGLLKNGRNYPIQSHWPYNEQRFTSYSLIDKAGSFNTNYDNIVINERLLFEYKLIIGIHLTKLDIHMLRGDFGEHNIPEKTHEKIIVLL